MASSRLSAAGGTCRGARGMGDSLAMHSRIPGNSDPFEDIHAANTARASAWPDRCMDRVAVARFSRRIAAALGTAARAAAGRQSCGSKGARRAYRGLVPATRRQTTLVRRPRFRAFLRCDGGKSAGCMRFLALPVEIPAGRSRMRQVPIGTRACRCAGVAQCQRRLIVGVSAIPTSADSHSPR